MQGWLIHSWRFQPLAVPLRVPMKLRVGRRGCGGERIDRTRSQPGAGFLRSIPRASLRGVHHGAFVAALNRAIGLLRPLGGLGHRAQASALFDLSGTRREVKSK
jgi:hypothetical protein